MENARLATVLKLSKSSTEILRKKSRRLAGLKPTPSELKDAKEKKRIEWNMNEDKKEKEERKGKKLIKKLGTIQKNINLIIIRFQFLHKLHIIFLTTNII